MGGRRRLSRRLFGGRPVVSRGMHPSKHYDIDELTLHSFWGRLAGIVAPIAGQSLAPASNDPEAYYKLLFLAGGVTLGCVVFTGLLPSKMVGKDSM